MPRTFRRQLACVLAALAVAAPAAPSPLAAAAAVVAEPIAAEIGLEELAARVAASEAVFAKYDLTLEEKYRDHREAELSLPGEGDVPTVRMDETTRVVRQGGRMYCEKIRRSVDGNGEQRTTRFVQVFDGQQTRTRWNEDPVKAVKGRQESEYAVSPHTLLYANWNCPLPLSAFIRAGYEESEERSPYVWTVDGTETVNGLKCVKATISHIASFEHPPWFQSTFYLCPERHYLPVRIVSIKPRWSETLPHAEQEVTKWKELRPGVWCPVEFRTEVNDLPHLEQGRLVPAYTRTERITDVSLAPQHPDEFFRVGPAESVPGAEKPNR